MMTICPICKSQGTLRRGHVSAGTPGYAATAPDMRYFVVCARCGSQFSVPPHEYFQVHSHRRHGYRQNISGSTGIEAENS